MNNHTPLVSIIIPVYNGEKYAKEAIESALNQTYKNIEVVVVNDGSTDSSEEIINSFGDKVRSFKKENGGVAEALNFAIKETKGEYISWLSHDDLYYPNKIARQVEELKVLEETERKNTIIFSHFDILDTFRNIKYEGPLVFDFTKEEPNYTYNMFDIFFSSKIGGCTLLFPKNLFDEIGYFDTRYRTIQDYHLFIQFFKAGVKFHYVKDILVTSRHHKGQDTNKMYSVHYEELNYLYRWAFDLFKEEFQKMPMWQFEHFLNLIKSRTLDKVYTYMLSEWVNGEWNKDKPTIWMYWENKNGNATPDSIRLCWKTIINQNKNDFQIKILTEDDVEAYLPDINVDYKLFKIIAHKADYIRFNLLYQYGGIWLDSDTICFRSFNEVKQKLKEYDFVCTSYKHENGKEFPIISFLASKPRGEVCLKIIKEIDEIIEGKLKKGFQPQWDMVGWLLSDIIAADKDVVYSYDISYFYPKNVESEKGTLNVECSEENFEELLSKTNRFCFGQSLAYSLRSDEFKRLSESDLLTRSGLLGDMFRIAFNCAAGVYSSTSSVSKMVTSGMLTKDDYVEKFRSCELINHIKFLEKEYEGKKVLLYGAGLLFEALLDYYDFSKFNVVAVTDKKIIEETEISGFRAIPPSMIKEVNPDVIMVTLLNIYVAESYLSQEIYKHQILPKIESLVASEMFLSS